MVKYSYKQQNIEYIIDIKYLKNTNEILIQSQPFNKINFSSFYTLQNLREMDVVFNRSSTIKDAFDLICKYFDENKPTISLMTNSKMIIEISKGFPPKLKFELLKKEENNNMDEVMLIGRNNNNNIIEGMDHILNELTFNLKFAKPKDNQIDGEITNLSYLLKFFLYKEIANKINISSEYENLISKDIIWILKDIKNNIDFIENNSPNNQINILNYIHYLKFLDYYDSLDLFSLMEQIFELEKKQKNEIENYWKFLSKYEEYNNEFDFLKDLKNCHFDYSIIRMNIVERDNPEEYKQKKKECKNMKSMILYHPIEIEPNSNNIYVKIKCADEPTYGEGFYFSDSIDYISSLKYNGKIPNIGETFSLVVCEIFYDEQKLEKIEDINSSKESIQNDILKVRDKVEPNGLIKIENYYEYDYDKELYIIDNVKGIINNVYILSKNYQIFPLYIFTLERNEYFVLYRDPNFIGKNNFFDYLKNIQRACYQSIKKKNIYFESSTEEALKFLLKRKNQKVILITSISVNSGKKFIEIARKIYGFNLLVLFFSSVKNKKKNSEWIKNFPNCLYITKGNLYKDYITKYNEVELKNLRKKDEEDNDIELMKFSFDFFSFPKSDIDINYSSLKYIKYFPYFRKIYILCPSKNLYLGMTKQKKIEKSEKTCPWYITSFEYKITFFSNGFYLNINNEIDEIPEGSLYMEEWEFQNISDCCCCIINTHNNEKKYLSMEDKEIIANKKELSDNAKFKFIDVIEY